MVGRIITGVPGETPRVGRNQRWRVGTLTRSQHLPSNHLRCYTSTDIDLWRKGETSLCMLMWNLPWGGSGAITSATKFQTSFQLKFNRRHYDQSIYTRVSAHSPSGCCRAPKLALWHSSVICDVLLSGISVTRLTPELHCTTMCNPTISVRQAAMPTISSWQYSHIDTHPSAYCNQYSSCPPPATMDQANFSGEVRVNMWYSSATMCSTICRYLILKFHVWQMFHDMLNFDSHSLPPSCQQNMVTNPFCEGTRSGIQTG